MPALPPSPDAGSPAVPTEVSGEGRLPENVVYFARALRDAGLRVGPASIVDALEAIRVAGLGDRADLYWTLHAVFVKRREDRAVFHEAFELFWRSRDLVEKLIAMFSPMADPRGPEEKPKAGQGRAAEALFGREHEKEREREPEIEVDATFSMSASEKLASKDFAQMTAAELAEAKAQIGRLRLPFDTIRTRRFKPAARGEAFDARAVMRRSMASGGDLLLPQFKARREVQPPLVVLADISGSMSQYSRIFLHFLHQLSDQRRRVHTFLFGTRLTNVTRALRSKDPDEAVDQAATQVLDWEGGTRIGETLRVFNRQWSRRVLGQGAVCLLITDGLERGEGAGDLALLDAEAERLHKSCRRLVWLNPLLRFEGFEPRAGGVRTLLPHVDEFRAVHSLASLSDLCAALGDASHKLERRAINSRFAA